MATTVPKMSLIATSKHKPDYAIYIVSNSKYNESWSTTCGPNTKRIDMKSTNKYKGTYTIIQVQIALYIKLYDSTYGAQNKTLSSY